MHYDQFVPRKGSSKGKPIQTWREDPKERPMFDQIVEYLAKMTGVQIRQSSKEHEYHSVEGLVEGEEEEEDVGGVNIYTEVESPRGGRTRLTFG